MSAPVILTTQSVLEYQQWQSWIFQPYATNNPTSWIASPLPPGMLFNTATGRISGAASRPGVYEIALTAINGDGPSTPQTFTIGIVAATYAAPEDTLDLVWDLGTGLVSSPLAPSGTAKLADGSTPALAPLLWLKRGDERLINVRPMKGSAVVDIAFATLKLALKQYEPESLLLQSTGFVRMADGADTFYRLAVTVAGPALNGALSNVEADPGTEFVAVVELEATWANVLTPAVGGNPLRTSSLNFGIGIARDLVP